MSKFFKLLDKQIVTNYYLTVLTIFLPDSLTVVRILTGDLALTRLAKSNTK